MKFKFNKNKIKNSIDSTSFEKLVKMEKEEGFFESADSLKNDKKINFFHLGNNNKWKDLLDTKVSKNIEEYFKKDMETLGYL